MAVDVLVRMVLASVMSVDGLLFCDGGGLGGGGEGTFEVHGLLSHCWWFLGGGFDGGGEGEEGW